MKNQKKFRYFGYVCLIVAMVIIFEWARGVHEGIENGLTPDAPSKQLGALRQNEKRKTEFLLKNNGSETIEVVESRKSCGCTSEAISNRRIEPGSESKVAVEIRTGASRGDFKSTVSIIYKTINNKTKQLLTLDVLAYVEPDYIVQPLELTFDSSKNQSRNIKVTCKEDASFLIEKIELTRNGFRTRHVTKGPETEIEVSFEPEKYDLDGGRSELILVTNNKNQPICSIPIRILADRPTSTN